MNRLQSYFALSQEWRDAPDHVCTLDPLKRSANKSILTLSGGALHYKRGEKNSVSTKKQ